MHRADPRATTKHPAICTHRGVLDPRARGATDAMEASPPTEYAAAAGDTI